MLTSACLIWQALAAALEASRQEARLAGALDVDAAAEVELKAALEASWRECVTCPRELGAGGSKHAPIEILSPGGRPPQASELGPSGGGSKHVPIELSDDDD